MPREDSLSSRFDYLFEPLDAEKTVDDTDIDEGSATAASDNDDPRQSAAPVRMAFAAFILATLGAVAGVAMLLLQQPNRTQSPVDLQIDLSPLPTSVADVPTEAATVPPPPPTAEDSETPQTIPSVPTQQEAPEPAPMSSPRAPQGGATNSPTTRAPISVAPKSRTPFPGQGPRTSENGRGGLLGGLL
jgi:hypothetical protein